MVLALPLFFLGLVSILLMSEGEETQAATSVIPIWGSWLFIWWCFAASGCLVVCFLWRRWKHAHTVVLLPDASKEPINTVRDTTAPPAGQGMGGYLADLVICAVVGAIFSSVIVWAWPDPYGYYWRPSIRTLLDDHTSFVRRRIRISGIVRSDWSRHPEGKRTMLLEDEGATIEIWYDARSTPQMMQVGERVEVVGYVFDSGPAPWSFTPAHIYRVD
ncbi:MAG: hypothetical protein D3924_12880 [Candidatus Electrothrix sp. AR4]|nr:hypothetical protein [Candidatus Electrothrix sp. AR4]